MRAPHPIPYQGSKRNISKYILPFFPPNLRTLIEPFAGSAAVTIAAAQFGKAKNFYLNDINEPLINLLKEIINNPYKISNDYEKLWKEQLGRERAYYDKIRDLFNQSHNPEYFIYLLARCVKASVRYNSKGEFNQSPDNRRKGRRPGEMKRDILAASHLLKGRTRFLSQDYKKVFALAEPGDLLYMDPPYQGVCSNRDPRYIEGIDPDELITELDQLNKNDISFILSYDGRRGDTNYGSKLPEYLGLHRIEIKAGRSSQSTLLGGNDMTVESLYLSKALIERLPGSIERLTRNTHLAGSQLELTF